MARTQILTNNGETQYREARANGTSAVTVKAGAALAADIDFILPVSLPAAQEFLAIDSAGQLSTAVGATGTLDEAYDSGGAGGGRLVTADTGALEITTPAASGNACLTLVMADNQNALFVNKTGTGSGAGIAITDAGTGTTLSAVKTGASGNALSVTGTDGTVTFGAPFDVQGSGAIVVAQFSKLTVNATTLMEIFNNGTGPAIHIDSAGLVDDGAILRIEGDTGLDASIEFWEAATQRFEIGYDQSAGGLVVGRLDFTNPLMFFEDTSGQIGIGTVTPDASYDVDIVGSGSTLNTLSIRASGASALHCLKLQNDSSGDPDGADIVGTGSTWQIQKTGNAIFGSAAATDSTVDIRTGVANKSRLVFGRGGSAAGQIEYDHGPDQFDITVNITQNWGSLRQAGLVLGLEAGGTVDGTNTLAILNGTAPTDTPNNGVTLYAEDVTASSELKVRDESGAVTVLSPHSEVYGHKLSEDMAWSFFSERAGKYVWVDMLRVVRLLEGLTGEELAFMGEAA